MRAQTSRQRLGLRQPYAAFACNQNILAQKQTPPANHIHVGQAFQPAGSGDFPVASPNTQ